MKFKKIFDKKLDKYGQSAIFHKYIPGVRCPCFDESTGYGDPQWHRDNPAEPNCNDEGYLEGTQEKTLLKAFIFPASDVTKKGMEELVLATIGQVRKDDYVYIGKSDVGIFNLSEVDYLEHDNRKFRILNPDSYKISDVDLAYVARLELLGDI